MKDLVTRQSVLTMLNKIENAVEDGDGFQFNEWIDYAKDIPSAEKTAEWIPVSERLPERDVSVLAYHKNVSFDYQYISWIDEYSGEWAGFIGNSPDEVLAWMPLPEPYKVE